jgi:predicted membrane channel-forming protein YqfA (hemolysin III family)
MGGFPPLIVALSGRAGSDSDPWPTTFGYHELFHACTAVAAICQYIAIWLAVF